MTESYEPNVPSAVRAQNEEYLRATDPNYVSNDPEPIANDGTNTPDPDQQPQNVEPTIASEPRPDESQKLIEEVFSLRKRRAKLETNLHDTRTELKTAQDELDAAKEQILSMQTRLQDLEYASERQPYQAPEYDDDVNEFNSVDSREIQNAVDRALASQKVQYDTVLTKMQTQMNNLTSQLESTSNLTEKQAGGAFLSALRNYVPNFLELEKHPQFERFAQTPDALSGYLFGDLLNDAIASHDAPRAAEIYKRFVNTYGQPAVAPGSQPPYPASSIVPNENRSSFEHEPPLEKKIYLESEIEKFMTDAAIKHMDTEQYNKQVALFHEAYADGRVKLR